MTYKVQKYCSRSICSTYYALKGMTVKKGLES